MLIVDCKYCHGKGYIKKGDKKYSCPVCEGNCTVNKKINPLHSRKLTMPEPLKSCPFCGINDCQVVYWASDGYKVACGCGVETIYYMNENRAIKAWNTRIGNLPVKAPWKEEYKEIKKLWPYYNFKSEDEAVNFRNKYHKEHQTMIDYQKEKFILYVKPYLAKTPMEA